MSLRQTKLLRSSKGCVPDFKSDLLVPKTRKKKKKTRKQNHRPMSDPGDPKITGTMPCDQTQHNNDPKISKPTHDFKG